MNEKILIGGVIILLIIAGGIYLFDEEDSEDSSSGAEVVEDSEPLAGITLAGSLEDVSGGDATGEVGASFLDATYMLVAIFEDLPDPEGTDFYEGWIVGPSVISTGKAELIDGRYVNTYESGEDLTDHTTYVLTLEPDDGDPAPAAHILEGDMNLVL